MYIKQRTTPLSKLSKVEVIVTIGPKSIESKILAGLIKAGATSFRINLSHSNKESLEQYFSIIEKNGIVPSVDTQGAQLRVEKLPDTSVFKQGENVEVVFSHSEDEERKQSKGNNNWTQTPRIVINHPEACKQMVPGDKLKVDFNGLIITLVEKTKQGWLGTVAASGSVIVNRAVDIKGKAVKLSPLTKFDKYAIKYALEKGCKEVYASFISSKEDVDYVKKVIDPNTKLISKIESAKGVANALEIIESSDAILIDRGDLSREISIPSVPMAVRSIIDLAKIKSCPIYVATNVLDSMMTSQLPSRAEISDIYTLLNAGATGLVLAAEVAIGDNPIQSTALLDYLIRLYQNHRVGLHGIGHIEKPSAKLIGEHLYNWL